MPLSRVELHRLGDPDGMWKAASLRESAIGAKRSVFLCHSHKDQRLVAGFLRKLDDDGWNAYVDWKDGTLPENPSAVTASKIKTKIAELDFFFFLATPNSMASRWCPWEIGLADGVKHRSSIFVIPTSGSDGTHGNDYIQLYQRIDFGRASGLRPRSGLAVWNPSDENARFLADF